MFKSSIPNYVKPYLDELNHHEMHNVGGDCKNPKCDYEFTPDNKKELISMDGLFTCPKCDFSYDYSDSGNALYPKPLSGLTPTQMGNIGENLIAQMGTVPSVGPVLWKHEAAQDPLDFIIGQYGVEVKTNHSEAQPRFKLGGAIEKAQKLYKAYSLGLTPALIGVRLNFYTDKADIFFRPEMSDTWIGSPKLQHIAQINFSQLNPFIKPENVPPPYSLPDSD